MRQPPGTTRRAGEPRTPSPTSGPYGLYSGDYPAAVQALEQDLGIFRATSAPLGGQAEALKMTGGLYRASGDLAR